LNQEILLYDHDRRPRSWSEIIKPRQCAVFVRNVKLGVSVSSAGKPQTAESATCILFDSVDEAEAFCRTLVAAQSDCACEVFDHEGRVNPPLLTVTAGGSGGGDEDTRGWIGRHRKVLAFSIMALALPFFYLDYRYDGPLVWTVVGINIIVAGLRLLLWHSGARGVERKRLARLDAHRQRERAPVAPI
jgi:hypothetical protein